MSTNLTPEYVEFVEKGGSLGHLVQEVIDRMQYSPGFLDDLNKLLQMHESPFEIVQVCNPFGPSPVVTDSHYGHEAVRKLKLQYYKSKSNPDDSRHATGDNANKPI